jgi:hypothetical protein
MTQPMTRTNAVLTTQITRAAAVVLGVGAVALGLTGLPDRSLPPAGSTLPGAAGSPPGMPPAADPGATLTPVSFGPVDAGALSARFAMLDNAPKIADATGVTVTTETGPVNIDVPESPAASGIADRVRFLGVVNLGDRNAAFVNVDGRQRFVQEGARLAPPTDRPEFAELVVERIMGTMIVVGDGAHRERLSLAERTGAAVTMADGGVVNQVEIPEEPAPVNRRELPQDELDRRARMIERQRGGNLGENNRGGVMPAPPVGRSLNMRGSRSPAAENADE